MNKIIIFVLIIVCCSTHIFSQNGTVVSKNFLDNKLLVTVDGGVSFLNGDLGKFKPGYSGRLGLEYYFMPIGKSALGFRVNGAYTLLKTNYSTAINLGDKPVNTAEIKTPMFDGNFGLILGIDAGGVIPYLVGAVNTEPWFDPQTTAGVKLYSIKPKMKIGAMAEAGIKILMSEGVSFNLSAAYHYSGSDQLDGYVNKKNDGYIKGLAGFSFLFGGKKDADNDGVADEVDQCPDTPHGVLVDEFGCPLDGDKDGVPDYLDNCPNTQIGIKVDRTGCPLDSDGDGVSDNLDKCPNSPKGVVVDKTGCPLDGDKDGIPDYEDKCPNTPEGVKVGSDGCPLDSDGDGVTDDFDKCPDTPAGTKVDNNGCPLPEVKKEPSFFILQGSTTFEFGKFTLTEDAKKELAKIAVEIRKYPDSKWLIEGHTDNKGSDKQNKKLSEDRANSVKEYLISLGVSRAKLSSLGLGRQYPVASNETEDGRQKNRRVVITKIN